MSISPLITFKAGKCDLDTTSQPYKVKPISTPGYIYLYYEDDLVHFCWRERSAPMDQPEIDLIMVPTDGSFVPYEKSDKSSSKTNGRIVALKFMSSSQRLLFWLQSKPQSKSGDASWFSPRDTKICEIVHAVLQGEEVNVESEIAQVRNSGGRDDDEDATMEDVQDESHRGGSGGAGAGATGGDIREEGAGAREGGADGGRAAAPAPTDASAAVQNFLRSLQGGVPGGAGGMHQRETLYTTLAELLKADTTVPIVDTLSIAQIDSWLTFLPPSLLLLAQESETGAFNLADATAETQQAALQTLSEGQKKAVLRRVLRSPQFHQSLMSLTSALRDGGLPSIADALGVKVQNGGLLPGGNLPLGGGDAVEAFVEGVKKQVEEEQRK